jgi:1-acyl-sn-glycerol-3-phosphate acyltransferase
MHRMLKNYHEKKGDLEQYYNRCYDKLGKILNPLFRLTSKMEVEGLENLVGLEGKSFVVVGNHQKSLDPIYICTALKDYGNRIRWISKLQNFGNDLFKIFLDIGKVIPLSEDRKMTPYAEYKINEAFKNKEIVGIFPEGTRNKTQETLLDFHTGAAKLCSQYDIPYVPIAIIGTPMPFKGKVTVKIGNPVYPENKDNSYENLRKTTDEMRNKMLNLLLEGSD